MPTWKRDAASGLVVLLPIILTAWVVVWLFNQIAKVPLLDGDSSPVQSFFVTYLGLGSDVAAIATAVTRVVLALFIFAVVVLAIGYLMRTAVGSLVEGAIDNLVNRLPGLRVVYNASKVAVDTALSGTEELQTPVKLETWNGMRMTAFKTGKRTEDGREVLFLPTAPNITTGFVIEVEPDRIEATDERVEDALTRILSAGFGETDAGGRGVPIDVVDQKTGDGERGEDGAVGDRAVGDDGDGPGEQERPVEADGGPGATDATTEATGNGTETADSGIGTTGGPDGADGSAGG